MRLSLLLALLLVTSGCTLFADRTVQAERSIDAAVWAFQSQRQRFPHDLAELQAFASRSAPLDTTPFSEVRFEHSAPEVLHVYLTTKPPHSETMSLGYAITH